MNKLVTWGDQIGVPIGLSIPVRPGKRIHESRLIDEAGASMDVCIGLNILEYRTYIEPIKGFLGIESTYEIRILSFTRLGIEFMKACRPT
jgi:hypothetical protein